MGGIGGFFAQRFIEVEAMPASRHIDFYDEDSDDETPYDLPDTPEPPFEAPREPAAETDSFGLLGDDIDGVLAATPAPAISTERVVGRSGRCWRPPSTNPCALYDESVEIEPEREVSFAEALEVANASGDDDRFLDAPRMPAYKRFPAWVPAPPVDLAPALPFGPIDPAVEPSLSDALQGRGLSAALTSRLLAAAKTHDLPFARQSGLREAVRTCLTRLLPRYGGLPHDGALVAVVGGGGVGKTRCAAAIATAYRSAGSLGVRAVVLGRYDSGAQLSALLEPQGVPVVTAERGSRAAGEIAASRRGQLVVADTPTVSPADPAGIGILGVELSSLAPEEVLVAIPATMNLAAARQMLTALAPLEPTAIVVTHADETDQLGTAAEISIESGLPIAFIHRGLELATALAPTDPPGSRRRWCHDRRPSPEPRSAGARRGVRAAAAQRRSGHPGGGRLAVARPADARAVG